MDNYKQEEKYLDEVIQTVKDMIVRADKQIEELKKLIEKKKVSYNTFVEPLNRPAS